MIILTTLKKTLFWSYERGTWQYDVMCVLILCFIFFSPNHWFRGSKNGQALPQRESAQKTAPVHPPGAVDAKVRPHLGRATE